MSGPMTPPVVPGSQQAMMMNFDFIIRCIYSCTNAWQLKIAKDMIDRFNALYDSKDMYDQLLEVIISKQASIE